MEEMDALLRTSNRVITPDWRRSVNKYLPGHIVLRRISLTKTTMPRLGKEVPNLLCLRRMDQSCDTLRWESQCWLDSTWGHSSKTAAGSDPWTPVKNAANVQSGSRINQEPGIEEQNTNDCVDFSVS
jgi:hypothetical protein